MTAPIRWHDDTPELAVTTLTLPCGLEVLVHSDRSVPLVAVWMGYRVGSSDEGDGDSGFAHLFEHMFKNSLHLGGRHHYQVLREAGATDANAQTGTDRTVYHEVMPRAAVDTALWIEADRMGFFLPGLDQPRLARQIAVVQSERRQRYENAPFGPERFAVAEALYPDGHPLRYLTIGRHEDIAAATLARVEAFYRTWYVPANATLVLAGDVDADEAAALCQRWFGDFPASARPARRAWPAPEVAGPVRIVVDDRLAALARVRRSWIGPAAATVDEAALDALAVAWALPGSGRLWKTLVHDRQWAQRVGVGLSTGRLGGEVHVTVDVRSGVDPAAVSAALDDELAALAAGELDPRGLDRAIRRREAATLWRLDGVGRRAALLLAAQLTTGSPAGIGESLARTRGLTVDAVVAAARRWLAPARMIEVVTRPGRGDVSLDAAAPRPTV
ncbi:MAG: insulinase family protein [Myxococcales bacterium]|nr:insulinase family protein [Myxococcales bacterium]